MKYQPGQSGNPSGRPPGSKNRAGAQAKALIERIFSDNSERIVEAFKGLEGRDLIKAASDLLPYVLPRLQASAGEIDPSKLTEEQLDQVLDAIKSAHNEGH